VNKPDFNHLVEEHYEGLYRFALSLARREADAGDLTQQTFLRWATKGHQLKEKSKAKTWLYTTLYREFLSGRRREIKFPHLDVEEAEAELPVIEPSLIAKLDAQLVMEALMQIEEPYRASLILFYLEDHSYQEIAEILEVPIGTVMSRLSRGKKQLRTLLQQAETSAQQNILRFTPSEKGRLHG
jgi:RNA polymerase sigma-70 factor (ECF subfamily)